MLKFRKICFIVLLSVVFSTNFVLASSNACFGATESHESLGDKDFISMIYLYGKIRKFKMSDSQKMQKDVKEKQFDGFKDEIYKEIALNPEQFKDKMEISEYDMVGIFAAFMTYELSYSNFKFIFEGGVDCVHCTLLFKLNNSWVALKAEYVLESETCEDGVKFLAMSMVDYIENIKWGLWKLSKEEEINCTMTLRPGYDGTIFTFPLMWLNVERLTRY